MTVTNVEKDAEQHTMTITSHFDAPIERVWELWVNPHLLERWWGRPTYPATVVDHDLTPGGKVTYFMTGPDGDTPGAGGGSSLRNSRAASGSRTASRTMTGLRTPRCPRPASSSRWTSRPRVAPR